MKGMSRREGRRGNNNGNKESRNSAFAEDFDEPHAPIAGKKTEREQMSRAPKQHGNNNKSSATHTYEHQLHGEPAAPQHQRGQVNSRSKDPRDQATLKALAAQKNRKGGRTSLIGGAGGVGRGANSDTLLSSFKSRLSGSTFRLMNEQLYTTPSDFARQLLSNEAAYKEYHDGYNRQLQLWPVNPVDIIIDSLKFSKGGRFNAAFHNMATKSQEQQQHQQQKWSGVPSNTVIADFGCGSAHLARVLKGQFKLSNTIHSLDLCNKQEPDLITECDIAHTPLEDDSVDIGIFSLSLMSTNWMQYLLEAHRTLKKRKGSMEEDEKNNDEEGGNTNNNNNKGNHGGLLKLIEVRSRMPNPDKFAELVESIGYKFVWGDVVGEGYFCAFDFEAIPKSTKIDRYAERLLPDPSEVLTPCLYKRR